MMHQLRLLVLLLVCAPTLFSCVLASREGLPSGSPFADTSSASANLLPQGIAVGDVTSQSALLWLRTDGPMAVQFEWAPVAAWDVASKMATAVAPVARTPLFTTGQETDFTLAVPIEGLIPATRYRYYVFVGTKGREGTPTEARVAARGEFTTLADVGNQAPVTFAWSGDLGGQGRCRRGAAGYPIFDVMRAQQLDFFLFLGDTMYSDSLCPSPPNEPGADFLATTLAEYRARHRYQRGAEALRRFLETTPVCVIWDDHEVRNDFSGPFDSRMSVGRQALREYWPIRVAADDPHRLYRTVRAGADLELFILDTRQYRSRNVDQDGPAKTMLGEKQLQWLLSGLAESTATWKVIVTSVPLSISKGGSIVVPGNDGWAGGRVYPGFEWERQVLVDHIVGRRIKNVVFLAGDVHHVQANAYDPNGDGIPDFHEFVAGPLSAASDRSTLASEGLRPTMLINENGYFNFGLIRVTTSSFDVKILDDAGATRFSYRLSARSPSE
ncbi:MAG TPA: alkaline phosphatase D family protein [Nitrospiraceae bacterium]|nr:alkaline phosphatase D family protein [Nitrospiraceae bacterium]